MLNAANKKIAAALIGGVLAAAGALTACSGKSETADAASALVAEASAALDRGDWQLAGILLDSLSAAYPKEIEAGRSALALRPRVMERKTEQEIVELQALMEHSAQFVDSIMPQFSSVARTEEQLEPYLVSKSVAGNWRERNTAIARLTPGGEFYMISSLAGRGTQHTALRMSAGGRSVTSGSVAFDATTPLSRESRRFSAGKADTLGVFAAAVDGSGPVKLEFVGGKKAASATLTAREVHAIADTWRLSRALTAINEGNRRLEQLKAKLQLARDQAARTGNEKETTEE